MIKLKDLIKEFVPGTLLDARKKPGDYWKGAISDTWYARSPEYGWRSSYDTEEEAKMWAEEGKDLEGNNEETAEHPPEPIEETVFKKGDKIRVKASAMSKFKTDRHGFNNISNPIFTVVSGPKRGYISARRAGKLDDLPVDDVELLSVNEAASYPSFEVDKNIRYKDTVVAKGYWTYTGKESGGKGVYLNTSNQQRLGFDKDDLSYFKKHLPDHFQINEVIKGKFIMNLEESVNEDTIPYSVGFPIVRKFADRLSFGPKLERDGNTFFLQGHMKIDNAAIKKELQRNYEIRRIDRGSRGSNEYYVYDKDSGYVMLVQPSKKDNWIQMSPFTTIEDWKKYE